MTDVTPNDYQAPMANGQPHPLRDIPPEVLEVARSVMREVHSDLYDPEMADPIADAVVMKLVEAGWIANTTCTSGDTTYISPAPDLGLPGVKSVGST